MEFHYGRLSVGLVRHTVSHIPLSTPSIEGMRWALVMKKVSHHSFCNRFFPRWKIIRDQLNTFPPRRTLPDRMLALVGAWQRHSRCGLMAQRSRWRLARARVRIRTRLPQNPHECCEISAPVRN
ncbi:hypothetical protein CBM2606_A110267 [Cupriavidus taiwanensis]|nr:hypothetical protein CBM2606_A110267 [Cupriavidus taiwanensis]